MQMPDDRQPPHSLDAEFCVIGAMILDPLSIDAVEAVIRADDFFRPAHQTLYAALVAMRHADLPIDFVTLKDSLIQRGEFQAVGGNEYLGKIIDETPNSYNARYYAFQVREAAIKRGIIQSGTEFARRGYDPQEPSGDILSDWQQRGMDLQTRRADREPLEAVTQSVCEESVKPGYGLSLSIPQLDFATGGLRGGNYMILAARPGRGKTTLGLNIARCLCSRDLAVLYVTREMTKGELCGRLMSTVANVPGGVIRNGTATHDQQLALYTAKAGIDGWAFEIDAKASTVQDIAGSIRRFGAAIRRPVDLCIIDYFQLLTGPGQKRYERFSDISTNLKAMAVALNIPIIVMSQFHRPEGGDGQKRPTIYQLKETGSLEQDADQVLLLHCPVIVQNQVNIVEASLEKNRHGPEIPWGQMAFRLEPWIFRMEVSDGI